MLFASVIGGLQASYVKWDSVNRESQARSSSIAAGFAAESCSDICASNTLYQKLTALACT